MTDASLTAVQREILNRVAPVRRGVGIVAVVALLVALVSSVCNVWMFLRVAELESRVRELIDATQRADLTYRSSLHFGQVVYVATHSHASDVSTLCSVLGCGFRHFSSCPLGERQRALELVNDHPCASSDSFRTLMSVAVPGSHSLALRHSTVGMVATPGGEA